MIIPTVVTYVTGMKLASQLLRQLLRADADGHCVLKFPTGNNGITAGVNLAYITESKALKTHCQPFPFLRTCTGSAGAVLWAARLMVTQGHDASVTHCMAMGYDAKAARQHRSRQ